MNNENLQQARHSCAHLLAASVIKLWPNAKNAIGPSIDDGFYQDFDLGDTKISENDFAKIESTMHELVKTWKPFEVFEVSADQARKDFAWNQYKLELIEEFAHGGKNITENNPGNFLDLCKGGHSGNPSEELKHFKLLSVAGAYWRGDEKNKMLTRIYGTCFATQAELEAYLNMLEEAKKRDHRKLGPELDLFTFSDLVGPGLPLFTPKGTIVRRELENFIAELRESRNFQRVWIPHIAKTDLYKTSGHWDKFEDDLFHVRSKKTDTEFVLKPMNCPHHTQIFASRQRSYREMPIRYYETTTIYRDENTGQLQGLTRVRSITQDDSHVFARKDQIKQEAQLAYEIISELYAKIGMELKIRLSTHDPEKMEKYLGTKEIWEEVEGNLRGMLEEAGREYFVGVGEAAFYGPKLDFMGIDSLGREWQLATIQLDMNQPERFKLSYINAEGQEERPVMIHVAVLGSIERFMGVLIEHTAGAFPVWLSPVQIVLAPVSSVKHSAGAHELAARWKAAGIRVEVDDANETVGNRVRKLVGQKIPYIVVIGDREIVGEDLSVRVRGSEEPMKISQEEFINKVTQEIKSRV